MAILLSFLLTIAAPSDTIEHRTDFGSMALIQEEWKRDPASLPIMHARDAWTKLHLRWEAPAAELTVELEDDGMFLAYVIKGYGCQRMGTRLRYSKTVGEAPLWRLIARETRNFAKDCPRVPAARHASHVAGFAAAHDDFVAGVEALKKRAMRVFRPELARCAPYRLKQLRPSVILVPRAPACDQRW